MQGRALQDPAGGPDLIFAEAEGGRQVMARSDRSKLTLTTSTSGLQRPQIQQPNVPSHDLSHRSAIMQYYRDKMQAAPGRS